jgi:hypothetical protein
MRRRTRAEVERHVTRARDVLGRTLVRLAHVDHLRGVRLDRRHSSRPALGAGEGTRPALVRSGGTTPSACRTRFCPTCYPTPMRKTSVYLNASEAERLEWLAQREGKSQAEIIRRAIVRYEPERLGDRHFAGVGVFDGPGDSVADHDEEELLQGFGE